MRGVGTRHAALLAVLLAAAGCRDAAEPFRPLDRAAPPDGPVLRLTYGPADDRTPVWSAGGDSIYFTTSSWEGNPLAPATIVALAADGMGSLRTVLRNVQDGAGRANWITAPALSDDRIAFVRLRPLLPESPCVGARVCPLSVQLPMVRLQAGELHVRAIDATSGLPEDVILPLEFEGYSQEDDPTAPMGVVAVSDYIPAQLQFATQRRSFFRPSWNAQGTELVVSDGVRLLRWTLGAMEVVPIPGTADGISPAWSPDGEWIAYTRHRRESSVTFTCDYLNEGIPACTERRTIHYSAPPEIVLTRPDGSEERVLGPGEDPAWSPDGAAVFASSDGAIVRIPASGGVPVTVDDTELGIEPAVSPDGTRIAFARVHMDGTLAARDIWIVDLP